MCAPQPGITHAEYAQLIRARIAYHERPPPPMPVYVAAVPRLAPPIPPPKPRAARSRLAPIVPTASRFVPADNDDRGSTPRVRSVYGNTAPRLADSPIACAFDTASWAPGRLGHRIVRRYATWFRGGVLVDDRAVGAVARASGTWRAVARHDAAQVVAKLAQLGVEGLREDARDIYRSGRRTRNNAMLQFDKNGVTKRAVGAYSVFLRDEAGRLTLRIIYLPDDTNKDRPPDERKEEDVSE